MSALKEMSDGYRDAAVRLRLALNEANEKLKTLEGLDYLNQKEVVLGLRAALREVRDLWELCDSYYESSYRPPPQYSVLYMNASKVNGEKT